MYNIKIYKDKNGKSNIEDYIKRLHDSKSKDSQIKFNKIITYIRLLREYGKQLHEPYSKYLGNNIWELRPLRDRILYSYVDNNIVILLSIFMKQTQKTPQREIEKAQRLLEDYIERGD